MTLRNDKPPSKEDASKGRNDELTRGQKGLGNPKPSAYDRYLKYGNIRKFKKNARKRIFRKIEKQSASITSEERERRLREAGI